jgi:hypothetical protein
MSDLAPVTDTADVVEDTSPAPEVVLVEHTPVPFTDVTVEHEGKTYICTQYGLLYEGHKHFYDLGIYLPAAPSHDQIPEQNADYDNELYYDDQVPADNPVRGRAGMPISWWRAQCAFRGLDTAGDIGNLQDRLTSCDETSTRMTQELKTLERDLLKDFIKQRQRERKGANRSGAPRPNKEVLQRREEGRGGEPRRERHPRGGMRGSGRLPSRKANRKRKPKYDDVMSRFGSRGD